MTQEEKQLLLKDLCARLPYRVKVRISSESEYCLHEKTTALDIDNLHKFILDGGYYVRGLFYKTPNFQLLPYLRPMSSMTEEERKEIENIFLQDTQEIFKDPIEIRASSFYDADALDWFLKKHFDYRKLIEKGLAVEAPEDMYKEE